VAFAAPYPGKIVPIDLAQYGGTMICQKDAFLCAAKGTSIGISFSRKIGRGLFGGEGFILQKLEGDGMTFMHSGGTITSMELAAGETLRVDTGCLVAFQPSVNYDIQFTGGIKNTLFGGEGLFLATLTGPERSFCSRCRLAGWQTVSMPPRRAQGEAVGRKVLFLVVWADCWMETTLEWSRLCSWDLLLIWLAFPGHSRERTSPRRIVSRGRNPALVSRHNPILAGRRTWSFGSPLGIVA
jgi:hypothetical protein